jgi:hypothetical protein
LLVRIVRPAAVVYHDEGKTMTPQSDVSSRKTTGPEKATSQDRTLHKKGHEHQTERHPLASWYNNLLNVSPALPLQPKLTISQPDDPYEQEADRVAERIMRMPEPAVQGKGGFPAGNNNGCKDGQEKKQEALVQRKVSAHSPTAADVPPIVHEVLRSPGEPLDTGTRTSLEPKFGFDFGSVRVHSDARAAESARAISALAYTVGNRLVFGAGQYSPSTPAGQWVLAHELTHAVQQDFKTDTTRLRLGDLHDPFEQSASRNATFITSGMAGKTDARPGTVQAGLVQRHPDVPCPPPAPPKLKWVKLDARPKTVYGPANDIIEQRYRYEKKGHSILTGSQFAVGGPASNALRILLPKGAQDRNTGNEFLNEYSGISRQLAPDIIDFTEHVIYEIKTDDYAIAGMAQLAGYYKLADALQIKYGGKHWNRDLAAWYPPHAMSFPGSTRRIVCTSRTDHSRSGGLILYSVYELRSKDDDEDNKKKRKVKDVREVKDKTHDEGKKQPQSVPDVPRMNIPEIIELNPEMTPGAPQIQRELIRAIGPQPSGSEYIIIAPPVFYQKFIQEPMMERTLERMRVHALDPRRNPIITFRILGWSIIGIYAASMVVVLYGGMILGAGAVAAPAAASSAATGGGAGVISLNAFRAARAIAASEAGKQMAKAAGVLIVIGSVRDAEAQATVSDVQAVRAVPVSSVEPPGTKSLDAKVKYEGQEYYVIGKAKSR